MSNAGVDKRFPKGTIYPGVIALYRALTEARHYRRMHRIQSQRLFGHGMNGISGPSDSASVVSAQDSAQVDQVQTQCCTVITMTVELVVLHQLTAVVASQVPTVFGCCYTCWLAPDGHATELTTCVYRQQLQCGQGFQLAFRVQSKNFGITSRAFTLSSDSGQCPSHAASNADWQTKAPMWLDMEIKHALFWTNWVKVAT